MPSNHLKRQLIDGKLLCPKCSIWKGTAEFHNCLPATFGKAYYCKLCACSNGKYHHNLKRGSGKEGHIKYRRAQRDITYKRKYGLTLVEVEALVKNQEFKCGICKQEIKGYGHNSHVDHDHKTGKIRGILCSNCNRGLGHLQDSPQLLKNAIEYLKVNL